MKEQEFKDQAEGIISSMPEDLVGACEILGKAAQEIRDKYPMIGDEVDRMMTGACAQLGAMHGQAMANQQGGH